MTGQMGFWSISERLTENSAQGDPVLEKALGRPPRWKGGRPPFDAVVTFRILVLQSLHGLLLEQAEYLVRGGQILNATRVATRVNATPTARRLPSRTAKTATKSDPTSLQKRARRTWMAAGPSCVPGQRPAPTARSPSISQCRSNATKATYRSTGGMV